MDQVNTAWESAVQHKENITFAIALLAFFRPLAPLGMLLKRRASGPRLEFGFEHGASADEVILKVVNAGRSLASDVRLRWNARSSMAMEPIPQPTLLLPGESLRIRFSIEQLAAIIYMSTADRTQKGRNALLGWLEITYHGIGWRRQRTGLSIIPSNETDVSTVVSAVALGPLPRRPIKQALPWVQWIGERIGFARRRALRAAEKQARADAMQLDQARAFLIENGVDVRSGDEDGGSSTHKLLGELGRRGWDWECYPVGIGYETVAEKKWHPSSSMLIRTTGATPEEAVILALASAIKEDQERGTDVGPFRPHQLDLDPPNFPPGDPRHDMDN